MKILLLWLAAGLLTLSHAATNLVTNGDFETGVLAPWTGTNATVLAVPKAASLTTSSGMIGQSFETTAGKTYYVGADMAPDFLSASIGTVTVQADGGGALLGSRTASGPVVPGLSLGRTGFVFTATTATATLRFSVNSVSSPSTASMTVDNVVVYELEPSRLAGRYSGTVTTTVAITTPGAASSKFTSRIAARVTSEGLIVLVSGTLTQGVVFSDGKIEFPSLGVRSEGAVKGRRITFTTPSQFPPFGFALTGLDASNMLPGTLTGTSTTTYVLTRVGP